MLLDLQGSLACESTPGTTQQTMRACVLKEGEDEHKTDEKCADARFTPCDDKNVCASSFKCEQVDAVRARRRTRSPT